MIKNYIKYFQFSTFRSPSSLKLTFKFHFYHKYLQFLNILIFNKNIKNKIYNSFKEKGFYKFSNSRTIKVAEIVFKKIKKLENLEKNFWKENGRASIVNIRNYFPELDKLFEGEACAIISSVFKSHFKIYYGVLNKNIGTKENREGSQLWHNDGGPGTCVNMMFYLSDVNKKHGPLQIIDWKKTKKIYWHERTKLNKFRALKTKDEYRQFRSEEIERLNSENGIEKFDTMTGKKGTVILFSNNTYHRGGFPDLNEKRVVIIFHLYPSNIPIKQIFNKYESIEKCGPYPKTPNFKEK